MEFIMGWYEWDGENVHLIRLSLQVASGMHKRGWDFGGCRCGWGFRLECWHLQCHADVLDCYYSNLARCVLVGPIPLALGLVFHRCLGRGSPTEYAILVLQVMRWCAHGGILLQCASPLHLQILKFWVVRTKMTKKYFL